MKKLFLLASFSGLLSVLPAAASIVVDETASPSGAFWNYRYAVSEAGTSAAFTDIVLTSADLSPTDVAFNFDSGGAGSWTWFDLSSTQLDFFNSGTGTLNSGDTLLITFTSDLGPGPQTMQAFNVSSGVSSNVVSSDGPAASAAVPEPASVVFLVLGLVVCGFGVLRRGKANAS